MSQTPTNFPRSPVRSTPRYATLDEARRMLIETCSVSFDDEHLDYAGQINKVANYRWHLAAARQEALNGRLFFVDYPTLSDDWPNLMVEREKRGPTAQPYDVTAIFLSNHQGANPLFVLARVDDRKSNLFTATPMKNDEQDFWGVPGFPRPNDQNYMTALLTAIEARKLKPI